MRLDGQIGFEDIDDNYKKFVDKFKPKKTTDDCYTPENVYNAVRDWTVEEYGIDPGKILRPFYPGGDYMRAKYPPGYTVVDNPPFSILSEIVHVYMRAKVPFLLFAPHLTLLNIAAGRTDVTRLICDGRITYENGAQVNTDFVTNLDPEYVVRTVPTLRDAIMEADKANTAGKTLPKYEYPLELVTAADLGMLPRFGVEWNLPKDEAIFIRALDAMKAQDRQIFGGGYIISHKAADRLSVAYAQATKNKARKVEEPEDGAKFVWELSTAERAAVEYLGREKE
jgi:hypothetical protein